MESFCCFFFPSIHGYKVFSTNNTDVTNWCRINYALYEEIEAKDVKRTQDVYRYSETFEVTYIHLHFTCGGIHSLFAFVLLNITENASILSPTPNFLLPKYGCSLHNVKSGN